MSDAFYIQKRDFTAHQNLKKYGRACSVLVSVGGEYDEATASVIEGSTKKYGTYGLSTNKISEEKHGSVKVKAEEWYLDAKQLTIPVTTSHKLEVGTEVFDIVKVSPVQPGNIIVMWRVWLAK